MALSILTHHMTGLSLGLGLVGWFAYHVATGLHPRRQVIIFSCVFGAVVALVVAPWGIPFIIHITDVGFRRELAGLWLPSLAAYRSNIIDSSLIGAHTYPSYLGITSMVLTIGGAVYALLDRRRLAGMAIVLLVLAWFSLGSNGNPLIQHYPFSALDVARFHLFMVPFMALLSGALIERAFQFIKDIWPKLSPRLLYALAVGGLAAILVFPALDAGKARDLMEPYQVKGPVDNAIQWLAQRSSSNESPQGPLYSVGLWTWHSFLIPYLADQPLVDGWHDEGASNVNQVRELRMMGWTGEVDIERAHSILINMGAQYVLAKRVSDYPAESSHVFLEEFEAHSEWFSKLEQWGEVDPEIWTGG